MNLKTLISPVVVAVVVMVAGSPANASAEPVNVTKPASSHSADLERLKTRLNEIQSLDIKKLPRSERRALRKEVVAINKEVKEIQKSEAVGGGVYISAGALIIIVILLILIL